MAKITFPISDVTTLPQAKRITALESVDTGEKITKRKWTPTAGPAYSAVATDQPPQGAAALTKNSKGKK